MDLYRRRFGLRKVQRRAPENATLVHEVAFREAFVLPEKQALRMRAHAQLSGDLLANTFLAFRWRSPSKRRSPSPQAIAYVVARIAWRADSADLSAMPMGALRERDS